MRKLLKVLAGSSSTLDSTLFPQLGAGQGKEWLPPACFSRQDLRENISVNILFLSPLLPAEAVEAVGQHLSVLQRTVAEGTAKGGVRGPGDVA